MSGSSQFGKLYTAVLVQKLYQAGLIRRVVDIGAGGGTYSELLRGHMPDCDWHAVEVWQPYIDEFNLTDRYDTVHQVDARLFDWDQVKGPIDLVFCGDILEHMEKQEAEVLVDRILTHTRYLLVSIPIVHYPQDEINGNPYEVHVKDDWSHEEVVATFPDSHTAFLQGSIGVYMLSRQEAALAPLLQAHQFIAPLVEKNLNDPSVYWQ
jgi:methyltransferase family protein